jgi:hypothetical protein
MPEGEPPLVDNYVDEYNGGCGSHPPIWQTLIGDPEGQLEFCGHSGTYLYNGANYRDTDWFIVNAGGSSLTASITPEYATYLFQLTVDPTCVTIDVLQHTPVQPRQTDTLEIATEPGEEVWLWVGPSPFSGLPEYLYLLNLQGLEAAYTPVEAGSWGYIKSLYR